MWASGLARASLLCSPFSRALCVPVVRHVQYSADRSTGVHCSRPTLGVYHTAPSLPVLWVSGIRLVGPSRVVVASRPTSMACMLLCRSFLQFGQPRAVLPRRLARTQPSWTTCFLCISVSRAQRGPRGWLALRTANRDAIATHHLPYVCIMFCFRFSCLTLAA